MYKKRNYRGRRPRRSYKPKSRWSIYSSAGKQLWKDVKTLKNLINVEFKVKDVVSSSTPSTTVPTTILLNGLTKGDDYNNRDGRQVRWKSIQMYLRSTMNGSATNTNIRALIYIDKQANETSAASTAILDTTTASYIDAYRNLSNRKRYVILADKRITLNTDYPEKITRWYKRLDMKQIFDDTDGGTVADITSNSLYVMFCSDEATNTPTIVSNFRLRFIDN